jgi:CxxC-x17-CxxC domain-containing protein
VEVHEKPARVFHSRDSGNDYGGRGGGGGRDGGRGGARIEVKCSDCGVQTTVPFEPAPGRPVFCRNCYQKRRG